MAVERGLIQSPVSTFLYRKWGYDAILVPSTVAIATSVTRVLPNNPRRLQVMITLMSMVELFLDFNAEVSITQAMRLVGIGTTMILSAEQDGELVTHEIWGQTQRFTGNVRIWETLAL